MAANRYPHFGPFPVIPAADLLDIDSPANAKSAARHGDAGIGKYAGMIVVRDAGSNDYRLVMAMGATPASVWRVVDGSTNYTPS